MAELKDIIFNKHTKVYISADESFELPENTLVVNNSILWYIRFDNTRKLVIDVQRGQTSTLPNTRWKNSPINTYDDLVFRIQTIQLLE